MKSTFTRSAADWNSGKLSSHADVLSKYSSDDHGDKVGEPPRPRMRDAAIADTHHKVNEVDSHSEVQALQLCVDIHIVSNTFNYGVYYF